MSLSGPLRMGTRLHCPRWKLDTFLTVLDFLSLSICTITNVETPKSTSAFWNPGIEFFKTNLNGGKLVNLRLAILCRVIKSPIDVSNGL